MVSANCGTAIAGLDAVVSFGNRYGFSKKPSPLHPGLLHPGLLHPDPRAPELRQTREAVVGEASPEDGTLAETRSVEVRGSKRSSCHRNERETLGHALFQH